MNTAFQVLTSDAYNLDVSDRIKYPQFIWGEQEGAPKLGIFKIIIS